ncbi:MAG: nitrate- and nitrite sensing domain-containing protein [Burkholderiaceae bacterium]
MKPGLRFLIAARRHEIQEFDQLARTSELVGVIGRLVHALQKERGLSNLLLGSGLARHAHERERQVAECLVIEAEARAAFENLDAEPRRAGNGTRLFSRVAWVLLGLDALPALRQRIAARRMSAPEVTAAFVKLIAGLLAVVFEAADGAVDPEISRLLVALFNFMQGKEFTGQERAMGAAAFAAGCIDAERQQQWMHLIEQQDRCLQVFTEFGSAPVAALWRQGRPADQLAELERLRRIACAATPGANLGADRSTLWFECCSRLIDAMRPVEERLVADLHALCARKIAQTREEIEGLQQLFERLDREGEGEGETGDLDARAFFERSSAPLPDEPPPTAAPYGRQLERAIMDIMREQSNRLQAISAELDTVRASLNERKLVERAKGLLMAHRRISEAEAHKLLRQTAMNQNRRLVEVAESVLTTSDLLSVADAPRRSRFDAMHNKRAAPDDRRDADPYRRSTPTNADSL